jgi:MerR family transcriptional regulator/heat shock protein HspR
MLSLDEEFLDRLLRETSICEEVGGAFSERDVERIRVARHLEEDLGLNLAGIEVVVDLRERMLAERRELLSVIEALCRRLLGTGEKER